MKKRENLSLGKRLADTVLQLPCHNSDINLSTLRESETAEAGSELASVLSVTSLGCAYSVEIRQWPYVMSYPTPLNDVK